ncbi:hypothetical protein SNEBB_007875 [Seison nebaliae]|nr:hypothetical protein SNEBB_007875 [Seison nebaliae]
MSKTAIVTASTAGIGLAIVQKLLSDGLNVVVSSRKMDNVVNVVEKLSKKYPDKVLGVPCHVGNANQRTDLFKKTIDKFGNLDVLVSNAAVNPSYGNISDNSIVSEDIMNKIFQINVTSTLMLIQEAKPFLQLNEKKNGSVVIMSSIAGLTPLKNIGAYSIAKSALLMMTKVLSEELAPNIRVNCVAPGIIKTDFSKALWENEEISKRILKDIFLKKFGESEDVANLVAFLINKESSYLTGEVFPITGGMKTRL